MLRNKKFLFTLGAIVLLATGYYFVQAKNRSTEYYRYNNYYADEETPYFIPEGCSSRDVKTTTQVNPDGSSDILRFEMDEQGNVTDVIVLTNDNQLDKLEGVDQWGQSSWGSTDPTGCWHVFQHAQPGQSETDLWVVSTNGPEYGLWQITTSGTAMHPDWNKVTGKIVFTNSDDGFMYVTDLWGHEAEKLSYIGDYAKYSPGGDLLLFTQNGSLFLLYGESYKEVEKGRGVWGSDGSIIYVMDDDEIRILDLTTLESSHFFLSNNIAPDPRSEPVFNILEYINQLFVLTEGSITMALAENSAWNNSSLHVEPTWWVWPSNHVEVKQVTLD
jgi:hypothetical protein